jgi:hypothetical protein
MAWGPDWGRNISFPDKYLKTQWFMLWCGRRESNPHGLTPNGFSYQLRLSPPPRKRLWSGLSLHLSSRLRCCPSSLYTFPSGLGSGLPSDRISRIWAVLLLRFPERALKHRQVRCVYRSATPAWRTFPFYPRLPQAPRISHRIGRRIAIAASSRAIIFRKLPLQRFRKEVTCV